MYTFHPFREVFFTKNPKWWHHHFSPGMMHSLRWILVLDRFLRSRGLLPALIEMHPLESQNCWCQPVSKSLILSSTCHNGHFQVPFKRLGHFSSRHPASVAIVANKCDDDSMTLIPSRMLSISCSGIFNSVLWGLLFSVTCHCYYNFINTISVLWWPHAFLDSVDTEDSSIPLHVLFKKPSITQDACAAG